MKQHSTRLTTWIIALLCSVLLSACVLPEDGDFCIAADDWGYPKIRVEAQHSLKDGESVYTQFAEWEDGDNPQVVIAPDQVPLVLAIHKNNKWTSWFNGLGVTTYCSYSGNSCSTIKKSQGLSFETCHNPGTAPLNPSDEYADCYAPCWLDNGYGLYMLSGPDPTRSARYITTESSTGSITKRLDIQGIVDGTIQSLPSPTENAGSLTVHLGKSEPVNDGQYIYLHNGLASSLHSDIERDHRLYFKIMDTFYADNAGGYTIHIKSGTKDAIPGPLESTVEVFEAIITLTSEWIYTAIVSNTNFIRVVQALLVLYIAFYGFRFMIGQSSATGVGNFVMHIFKVGLVIQLISPTSWEFFYLHLFRIFTEGVPDLLGLLVTPFENYDPSSAWATIDMMLKYFFSGETWTKAYAIFFSHPVIGSFIIAVIFIAITVFIIAVGLALLIYLQAYTLMGILLILFPPLLLLILFEKTKGFFEEWISQMIAIAVQFILLFATLGLFSTLIMGYMQKTMGYKTCLAPIYIGNQGVGENEITPWTPFRGADLLYAFGNSSFGIPFPNVNDTAKITLTNGEKRFRDAPYLDTVNNENDEKRFDKVTTERFFYLNMLDAIPFLFAVYLSWQFFRNVLPSLAELLKGSFRTGTAESGGIFGLGGMSNTWAALFGKKDAPSDSWLENLGNKGLSSGKMATVGSLGMNRLYNGLTSPFRTGAKGTSATKKASNFLGRRGGLLGGLTAGYFAAKTGFDATKSSLTPEQRDIAEKAALTAQKQKAEEELKAQEAAKKDATQKDAPQTPKDQVQEDRAKRADSKKPANPKVQGLKQKQAELQRYVELLDNEARGTMNAADKAELTSMKGSMPSKAAAEAQISTLSKNIGDLEGS